MIGSLISLGALAVVGEFGVTEIQLSLVTLPGVLFGFWISTRIAAILDKGYIRHAILALSAVASIVAIFKQFM